MSIVPVTEATFEDIVLKADRVLSMEMKDLKHFEGYDMIVVPAAGRASTISLPTTA